MILRKQRSTRGLSSQKEQGLSTTSAERSESRRHVTEVSGIILAEGGSDEEVKLAEQAEIARTKAEEASKERLIEEDRVSTIELKRAQELEQRIAEQEGWGISGGSSNQKLTKGGILKQLAKREGVSEESVKAVLIVASKEAMAAVGLTIASAQESLEAVKTVVRESSALLKGAAANSKKTLDAVVRMTSSGLSNKSKSKTLVEKLIKATYRVAETEGSVARLADLMDEIEIAIMITKNAEKRALGKKVDEDREIMDEDQEIMDEEKILVSVRSGVAKRVAEGANKALIQVEAITYIIETEYELPTTTKGVMTKTYKALAIERIKAGERRAKRALEASWEAAIKAYDAAELAETVSIDKVLEIARIKIDSLKENLSFEKEIARSDQSLNAIILKLTKLGGKEAKIASEKIQRSIQVAKASEKETQELIDRSIDRLDKSSVTGTVIGEIEKADQALLSLIYKKEKAYQENKKGEAITNLKKNKQ